MLQGLVAIGCGVARNTSFTSKGKGTKDNPAKSSGDTREFVWALIILHEFFSATLVPGISSAEFPSLHIFPVLLDSADSQ
ncbi:hypothetical protein WISP_88869 [Willisornis vidua]|uniref:Uncharacterized protein n=1 Tax=Willisornis vidua TaxID=1566151 RepID=A0ABQ9D234_9PASS|nr:hypothetical protein WISP_88869 [Willisornis vidua]